MVAPVKKVVHSKVTTAILRFINRRESELQNVLRETIKTALDSGLSRADIIDRLKCTFFISSVPLVVSDKSVALGVAPFVLKLLFLQIDKVDWEYILDRLAQPSPELN